MAKKRSQAQAQRLLSWTPEAWEDYLYWQEIDLAKVSKINDIIYEIRKQAFKRFDKPEPLKHGLTGYWSRHANGEHRLVYRVNTESINIVSCRYHY